MIFLEFDLAGAEWVIVAYASNDANMIRVVNGSASPHVVTGTLITGASEALVEAENKIVGSQTDPGIIAKLRRQHFPELLDGGYFVPRTMSIRQCGKKSNHGLNYGMQHRTFALQNEIAEKEAERIVELYSTKAYPGIQNYWLGIRTELRKDRTLHNCFGRKVRLLGDFGNELWQAGYSFKPQSTVADIMNQAMRRAYVAKSPAMHAMEMAAQVHDSLLVEYPEDDAVRVSDFCQEMTELLRPELTYGETTFRLNCDVKVGRGWGSMTPLGRDPAGNSRNYVESFEAWRAAA